MSTRVDTLKETILTGDKDATLTLLGELREESFTDMDIVQDVTNPAIIGNLHEMLIEHLGANNRNMLVKGRVPNIRRRAYCFIQAMENGVRRIP